MTRVQLVAGAEWIPESPEQLHCCHQPSYHHPGGAAAAATSPSHRHGNREQRGPDPAATPPPTKTGTVGSGPGSGSASGFVSVVPANGDNKKVFARKFWGTVRNRYGFVNRNDTKEGVFVHQTAIKKNNLRKYLRSVGGDGETVESDVEREKCAEAANVTDTGGVPVQRSKYAADHNPNRRYPHRRGPPRSYQQNYHKSGSGVKNEGSENAQEGQTQGLWQYCRRWFHLTIRGDPVGVDLSIPTLLCREK